MSRAAVLLLILAVVATAYRGTLSNGFTYDDRFLITGNALLQRPFDPIEVLGSSFWEHTPLPAASYYRPLVIASFALDATLGGFRPTAFHLTNLGVHLASTGTVALLTLSASGSVPLAAAAALLFGLHPINTEPVLWVVGRCDLLAGLFGLIALLLFLDEGSRISGRTTPAMRSLASGAALFLALLSKEAAVAVLGVMCLHVTVLHPDRRPRLRRLLGPVVGVALYLALRVAAIGASASGGTFLGNPLIAEGPMVRVATTLQLFGRYTVMLLAPVELSADYSFDSIALARSPFEPAVLGSLLLLVICVLLTVWARGRAPLVALGMNVFLCSTWTVLLVAALGGGTIFAERYMYMPSAGMVLVVVGSVATLASRMPAWAGRRAVGVGVVLVALAFAMGVQARVPDWRDDLALFRATVAAAPHNAMANNNLANAYFQRGDLENTRVHCLRALEIYPAFANPYMCLGDLAMAAGAADQAAGYFRQAAALGHPEGYLSLGNTYIALGRYEQAEQALRAGVHGNPNHARYLTQLGVVAFKFGRTDEAFRAWQRAITLNPAEAQAVFHLGTYHERRGEAEKAREYYQRFLALDPPGLELFTMYARERLGRVTPAR